MTTLGYHVPDLYAELQALLDQIPPGRVTTYGDLAMALGSSAASRWVGEFLRDHDHDTRCPCHRVVRQNGDLGLYISGHPAEKKRKLKSESIPVAGEMIDLKRFRWADFDSRKPLQELSRIQKSITEQISLKPLKKPPRLVAGVDTSYVPPKQAFAAYSLVDVESGELVWSITLSSPVKFPYIPGYLTFREIPALLRLFDRVRSAGKLADLIFVDGTGVLHPRNAGIATHFGVLTDTPTIGVAKKLLCGQVDLDAVRVENPQPIVYRGRTLGMALKTNKRFKPIFVSPGQFIDVESAVRLTQKLIHGHKLPEPIYWADSLSRQAARKARENLARE